MRILALAVLTLAASATPAYAERSVLTSLHCRASNGVSYHSQNQNNGGLEVMTSWGFARRPAIAKLTNASPDPKRFASIITLTVPSSYRDSKQDRYLLELDGLDPEITNVVQKVSGRVTYGWSIVATINCEVGLQKTR